MTTDELPGADAALSELLAREFDLRGTLTPLPGERDANYRLQAKGDRHLVKVFAADAAAEWIALQTAILTHLAATASELPIPRVRVTSSGATTTTLADGANSRAVIVTTWLPGVLLADTPVVEPACCEDLGRRLAELDLALQSFPGDRARRTLKWDLQQSQWIAPHLDELDDPRLRTIARRVYEEFENHTGAALRATRQSVVHNDANDHNVLIDPAARTTVTGLIDFGDACHSALVAEVAIAASYVAMHTDEPLAAIDALVRGYHARLPLTDDELELVVPALELRLVVSVVNSTIEAKRRPDDPYVTTSRDGAIRVLKALDGRSRDLSSARLRIACGVTIPGATSLQRWLQAPDVAFAAIFGERRELAAAPVLDMSFGSTLCGDDPTTFDPVRAAERIAAHMQAAGSDCAIGRYGEVRPPHGHASLGVEAFAPAGTIVHAPLAGILTSIAADHVVIDHHPTGEVRFAARYGRISPDAGLMFADTVAAGQQLGVIAPADTDALPAHVHVQLVAYPDTATKHAVTASADDLEACRLLYPDPAPLLGLDPANAAAGAAASRDDLQARRARHFSANQPTSYRTPLAPVRGHRHFLFDAAGSRYLDAYNNVPHVGHCHPRVVAAIAQQTALLATNTRYLHDGMPRYAERLAALLPASLDTFLFTASGSEANELALRLAHAHTGATDVCVMDHGYHGHTNAAMSVSPYKINQPGGPNKPDHVHVTAQPDVYRGVHRGADAGTAFGAEVAQHIRDLHANGRRIACYLCECLPSVGGQLVLPDGFLALVYEAVRSVGGICIADDVQTALWRTGAHCFGFAAQGVVPDILVLGKPIGNGFPMGAVVTTRRIAESFAGGPEFFSTFGGSTVAMAAGNAVLDVLQEEGLPANASAVGEHLLTGLGELQRRHHLIGDVRGAGLFLGVELALDDDQRTPATIQASRIKNRLRDRRVLIGTDGPYDNVLKIRPPMTFSHVAADHLLTELDLAFRSL